MTALLFNTSAGDALANVRAFVTPGAAEVASALDAVELGTVVIPKTSRRCRWLGLLRTPLASRSSIAYSGRIIGNRFEADPSTAGGGGAPVGQSLRRRRLRRALTSRSHGVAVGVAAGPQRRRPRHSGTMSR